MWSIISALLACMFVLVVILLLWSSGKQIPFVDKNGKPLAGSIKKMCHEQEAVP